MALKKLRATLEHARRDGNLPLAAKLGNSVVFHDPEAERDLKRPWRYIVDVEGQKKTPDVYILLDCQLESLVLFSTTPLWETLETQTLQTLLQKCGISPSKQ